MKNKKGDILYPADIKKMMEAGSGKLNSEKSKE